MKTTTTDFGRKLRNLVLAGAVAATAAGALAAPALAQDRGHGRGDEGQGQAREWRHDRDDWGYRPYAAVSPGYGYYGYYDPYAYAYPAPAPVYVAPPAVEFSFPIHIR